MQSKIYYRQTQVLDYATHHRTNGKTASDYVTSICPPSPPTHTCVYVYTILTVDAFQLRIRLFLSMKNAHLTSVNFFATVNCCKHVFKILLKFTSERLKTSRVS